MSVEPQAEIIPLNIAFDRKLGNEVFIPFEKTMDANKRIIRGYATTDALDREDQIVTKSAVKAAIQDYIEHSRGTIRADHRPPSVGQTVHHELDDKGLMIHARINKGYTAAEDVWAAILQDAYNAFSIGGMIREAQRSFDKELGKHVTEITKISIAEISVVDAPANPECGFQVLSKSLFKQYDEREEKSMTDEEKEEPTEKMTPDAVGGAPSVEDRLGKLEAIVSKILERLEPPQNPSPVAASLDIKDLSKSLLEELTPVLEQKLTDTLGLKTPEAPLKKAHQETPAGLVPEPPKPKEGEGAYTLSQMYLKAHGYNPEADKQ